MTNDDQLRLVFEQKVNGGDKDDNGSKDNREEFCAIIANWFITFCCF